MEVLEEKPQRKADPNLLQDLLSAIEDGKFNKKQLATKIGVSATTISLYLQDKYTGDIDKLETALKQCLSFEKNVSEYQKVQLNFVKTNVAERIYSVANICRMNSEICVCYGNSGLGKTVAINQYAKDNAGVYVIDPNEGATAKNILLQLADKLKITAPTTKVEDLMEETVKKLKGSNFLIIVDESENLNAAVFRALRKIHDKCDFTFGLLFIGTQRLYVNLKHLKGDFIYLINRIGYIEALETLNFNDVQMLVKQVFPNSDTDVLDAFQKESGNNARILFNLLKRTNDLVNTTGDAVNASMVHSARSFIFK